MPEPFEVEATHDAAGLLIRVSKRQSAASRAGSLALPIFLIGWFALRTPDMLPTLLNPETDAATRVFAGLLLLPAVVVLTAYTARGVRPRIVTERVRVTPAQVQVGPTSDSILSIVLPRTFPIAVDRHRASAPFYDPVFDTGTDRHAGDAGRGVVAYTDGGRTVRLGCGLDANAAHELIDAINSVPVAPAPPLGGVY